MHRTLTLNSSHHGDIMQTSDRSEMRPTPLQFISTDLLEYYRYIEVRYLSLLNLADQDLKDT